MKPRQAPPDQAYLAFIRDDVRALQGGRPVVPPATVDGWHDRLDAVAVGLERSFGRVPKEACDLAPEVIGTVRRDGYAIERLTFQSRPGVRVTANLYRPDPVVGRRPGVLSVHGHWAWARIDPHVQARCIGLARLGYVSLAVDAFGAGERAIEPGPGTYHGALDGAMLWPLGLPLLGLQVYDNRRAVDYLASRPEVDPKALAITGASGGGNQSLYAGATDTRLKAVVPVCGVGTYESYLGTGCCVCEVNAGALTYATTGDLLAMIAPRALLVINATQDAVQFSVAEASKSVAYARERFRLLGADEKLRHLPVESGHDYNRAMREALYGWLDRWLANKGDGRPVAEAPIATEDPQVLRCYPDGPSRPKTIVTIPEFALREGRARLKALPEPPDHRERWEAEAAHLRGVLGDLVGGPKPGREQAGANRVQKLPGAAGLGLAGEMSSPLSGTILGPWDDRGSTTTLLIRFEGSLAVPPDPVATLLGSTGRSVVTVDLRTTGRHKPATGDVRGLADHNEAEWGLWIGRPLLWQWVRDALAWVDGLADRRREGPLEIVGIGPFGLVALVAAGLRPGRFQRVGLVGPLVSLVGDDATPWKGLPMGLIVPNLLDLADVGHLAALVAPARLVIAGAVEPSGKVATPARLADCFRVARSAYAALGAGDRLSLLDAADLDGLGRAFGGP